MDIIRNGRAFGGGGVAARLLANRMDTALLRPWLSDKDGRGYHTLRDPSTGKLKNIVANYDTPAVLLKDEWKYMDRGIIEPVLPRLQVWAELMSRGLTYTVPNGMATTVIEEQTETDAGFAAVSMNGLGRSDRDRPEYDIRGFPLPIIHGEFSIDLRHLMQTRVQGRPFDISMGRKVTRRVVEKVENMAIGEATTYKYAGYPIYGLTNHPNRYTKTLTLPTDPGWTPRVLVDEVIQMLDTLQTDLFNGPFGMYFSPAWMKYMAMDYSDVYSGETLASRLGKVADISFMRKLEYGLSDFQIIIFQLTDDVIRAVNGMDLRTLQWQEKGGLELLFKVMCIYVTQLRTRENDDLGVIHGVAA
jgi:hypothetical protein